MLNIRHFYKKSKKKREVLILIMGVEKVFMTHCLLHGSGSENTFET